MVEAEDVDGNEEEFEGPVSQDHSPPEVECKMSVISQQVRMCHCAPVNNTGKHSDRQHNHQWVSEKKSGEVSEMMNCPGESEGQEEGREVAELQQVNSCHVSASVAHNNSLIEVDKGKEGKPDDDVANAAKDNEANQAGQ